MGSWDVDHLVQDFSHPPVRHFNDSRDPSPAVPYPRDPGHAGHAGHAQNVTHFWGFGKWRVTPIAGWFINGKSIYKWMMTGGTPILGNHQCDGMQLCVYEVRKIQRGS